MVATTSPLAGIADVSDDMHEQNYKSDRAPR